HYDTSVHSPGAADDSTGIAAILEAARALQARKDTQRDLIVLFTDAEEIGLEGARIFFEEHALAPTIGFIINLEARGGGGRATMFETGRGDGPTIKAFAPLAWSADGGIDTTSLASFMYERMPNGTDFTIPRNQGAQGINIAFVGRARQYHTAESTPENLDQGSLQHIGSQTLEMASRMMQAQAIPPKGDNRAYADVFGRIVIHLPLWGNWIVLVLSAAGLAFSVWRARAVTRLGPKQILQGALDGVWFISASLILCQGLRLLAVPVETSGQYYILLRRLPWMEASAALAVLALAFILMSGARAQYRRLLGYGLAAITVLVNLVDGVQPVLIGAGTLAAVLSLWPGAASRTQWGGWIGSVILAFALGIALQIMAPQAALIFVWPVLLAVIAMCVTAAISPSLSEMRGLLAPAIATIIGGAWLMGYGHLVFLGIGISLPGALGIIGFLVLLFVRPLVPARDDYWLTILAVVFLLASVAIGAGSRLAEPSKATAMAEKATRLSLQ
ncbi:M20/M25/M40 family metallo-hydrolase, partial [Brevundimonas sp.]